MTRLKPLVWDVHLLRCSVSSRSKLQMSTASFYRDYHALTCAFVSYRGQSGRCKRRWGRCRRCMRRKGFAGSSQKALRCSHRNHGKVNLNYVQRIPRTRPEGKSAFSQATVLSTNRAMLHAAAPRSHRASMSHTQCLWRGCWRSKPSPPIV